MVIKSHAHKATAPAKAINSGSRNQVGAVVQCGGAHVERNPKMTPLLGCPSYGR